MNFQKRILKIKSKFYRTLHHPQINKKDYVLLGSIIKNELYIFIEKSHIFIELLIDFVISNIAIENIVITALLSDAFKQVSHINQY